MDIIGFHIQTNDDIDLVGSLATFVVLLAFPLLSIRMVMRDSMNPVAVWLNALGQLHDPGPATSKHCRGVAVHVVLIFMCFPVLEWYKHVSGHGLTWSWPWVDIWRVYDHSPLLGCPGIHQRRPRSKLQIPHTFGFCRGSETVFSTELAWMLLRA